MVPALMGKFAAATNKPSSLKNSSTPKPKSSQLGVLDGRAAQNISITVKGAVR
jgi:hypothetical protein